MGLQGKPLNVLDSPVIFNTSPTATLRETTLDITATTPSSLNLANGPNGFAYRWLNFTIGGAFVIQSASLTSNQFIKFIQTGGTGPIFLKLDNAGTIGGLAIYTLTGSPVQFRFDGTNLV